MDQSELETKLGRLTRRGISAFAARCARRLQPLATSVSKADWAAINRAIEMAEAFARADLRWQAVAAAAASSAWQAMTKLEQQIHQANPSALSSKAVITSASAAAWSAASDTKAGAIAAAVTAWSTLVATMPDQIPLAQSDIHRLLSMRLKTFFDRNGKPIDPSEFGPLGPFWPDSNFSVS